HSVTLWEKSKRLGGQAQLAQLLPHRSEFGGIITNLAREMELAKVDIRLGIAGTRELIAEKKPDVVILATGSEARMPRFEQGGGIEIAYAHDVIRGTVKCGKNVVVYDWLADWIGVG